MRKLLLLMTVMSTCIAADANSTSLTNGNGNGYIIGTSFNVTGSFNFQKPGLTVLDASVGDLAFAPGLTQCQGCNPFQMQTLVFLCCEGGAIINGGTIGQFGWVGTLSFTAISFNSTFGPHGNLNMIWLASESGNFQYCGPPNCDEGGSGQFGGFSFNKNWRVNAHFSPGGNGLYDFQSATFTTVPEPTTVGLLCTGLLGVGWRKFRRKW